VKNQVAFGQGFTNARDESLYLAQHVLSLPCQEPDWVDDFLDAKLSQSETEKWFSLFKQRIKDRLPAYYITGEAWLQGVRFLCDQRALIPRSLIAELIPESIPHLLQNLEPNRILDMCCGGGSLTILMAMMYPNAEVVGVDLSKEALELAKENVQLHGLGKNINLVESDLFSYWKTGAPLYSGNKFYDLMICNPPYVNAHSMSQLPPEFLHEPRGALASGQDGMDFIRRLLKEAKYFLREEGWLVLEIGHEYEYFVEAFPDLTVDWLTTSGGDFAVCAIPYHQL
jgi:ribosomal protein L3 glutamine methyltransferase